ncbi:MAG: hypothetical protein Q9163_001896, partial [Psora crenata]
MHFSHRCISASLVCASLALASPLPNEAPKDKRSFVERDGTNFTVFEHAATGAKMEFVTNSGICETTPGVNQYSGYLSVGTNLNMWFWFFEARSNPSTAPLAAWFNGGPGCSSMIGLFQENGPCHFVDGASTPSLNEYSFNNVANMLYIDQPIGTGFSYGDEDEVTSTLTAAPYVWTLLQAFFAQFPQYENRNFGIFTESYGGHYGPEFADYVEEQNAAITAGTVKGEAIKLIALGINNGWFDAALQEQAYVDFSYNNTYKPMITAAQHAQYLDANSRTCAPALAKCRSTGSNADCTASDNACYNAIEGPLSTSTSNGGASSYDFDVYDIRQPSNDPYPPETYATYLTQPSVVQAIGAQSPYTECANEPYQDISSTGDNSRSFLPQLSDVVKSGVQTVVWAGDADWICNWFGNQIAAEAVDYPGQAAFQAQPLVPYTVAGNHGGDFKQEGNFAFLRVFGAGH